MVRPLHVTYSKSTRLNYTPSSTYSIHNFIHSNLLFLDTKQQFFNDSHLKEQKKLDNYYGHLAPLWRTLKLLFSFIIRYSISWVQKKFSLSTRFIQHFSSEVRKINSNIHLFTTSLSTKHSLFNAKPHIRWGAITIDDDSGVSTATRVIIIMLLFYYYYCL